MSDFAGPIHLSEAAVRERVPAGAPGAYALGHARPQEGAVFISYVGRDDRDLQAALLARVGSRFTACFFRTAATPEEAYALECRLWHDLGGPEGDLGTPHPVPPGDVDCPACVPNVP